MKSKRVAWRRPLKSCYGCGLQSGFDLESPGFQKRLGDVFGVLVAACPLPQTSGPQILVRGELVFVHDLFEFGDGRDNGPDRLGLAPVRVSASLGPGTCLSYKWGNELNKSLAIYMIPRRLSGCMETQPSMGQLDLARYPIRSQNVIGDLVA